MANLNNRLNNNSNVKGKDKLLKRYLFMTP